ncbi:MAG: hypothetical protein ACOY0T_29255 [Myxococcota bacterium]
MTQRRALILAALATVAGMLLFAGGVLWFLFGVGDDLCANSLLSEYPSPDGGRKLVVFQRDCGATTGFSTQVSLLDANDALPNAGGNVFSADTNHGEAESGAGGGPRISVRWTSTDSVTIEHSSKVRMFTQHERFDGVTIHYAPSN